MKTGGGVRGGISSCNVHRFVTNISEGYFQQDRTQVSVKKITPTFD